MSLKQLPNGHTRRLAGPHSAPVVALHTAIQVHAQLAPSRRQGPAPNPSPSPCSWGPSHLLGAFPAPIVAARRTGPVSHVCAAAPKDKEIEFDVNMVVEELSPCRRRATVTVPARAVKQIFNRGLKRLERDVVGPVPGFQTGKLPLSVLVSHVGGQDKFKFYCLEELLLTAMPKLGEKAARQGMLVDGESWQVPTADVPAMLQRYDPGGAFSFTALFEVVLPVVWRTPLEELCITVRDTGDLSTDVAAADDLIRQHRKQHGFSRVVASRGLAQGDTLVMDLQIKSKATGQVLPGLSHTRISFDTDVDMLGVTEGMLGMKVGETRSFPMKLPEDYEVEFWQNMPVIATVKVHEIFEWTLPEFDDAYVAQHHGSKWRSAAEMREALIASTALQRLQLIDKALEDEVVKAVAGAVDMPEVPPRMVEQLGERQFQAQLLQMMQDRIASPEDIDKLATEEMVREFIQERRKDLEDQARFNLAVDDIFSSRGLQLDEEAVQAEFQMRLQQMEAVDQPFSREELRDDVRETVKNVTVIEWLKDNVRREILPYNDSGDEQGAKNNANIGSVSQQQQQQPAAA